MTELCKIMTAANTADLDAAIFAVPGGPHDRTVTAWRVLRQPRVFPHAFARTSPPDGFGAHTDGFRAAVSCAPDMLIIGHEADNTRPAARACGFDTCGDLRLLVPAAT